MDQTLQTENANIARRFASAAATYNAHSSVHQEVAEDVLAKITLTQPKDILDVGAGTGILTHQVISKFPEATVSAQDLCADLLEVNQAKHPQLKTRVGNFTELTLSESYDAIVSSAALHWLNDPQAALQKIKAALKPGGQIAFSVMTRNTFPELAEARKFATSKANRTQLRDKSFWIEVSPELQHEVKNYRIALPTAENFLRMLHEMGVTGSLKEAPALTRGELNKLCSYYNQHFKVNGQVYATYEVLILWST